MLLDIHVFSWVVAFVLFAVTFFMQRNGASSGKMVQMVLRLFYILIIITGIMLVARLHFAGAAVVKGILGLLLVGFMEMILTRRRKGRSTGVLWIVGLVDLVLVFYFGYAVLG